METVELLAQKNLKDLITKTKEEQISQSNNEQLPELYKSCPISMLSQYLQTLREEFYERLHMNIETSMHNKALYGIKDKSHIFKSMMKDYYIIHDIECDLISNFLTLIQNHIDAAKKTENVTYLGILGTIKENIYFKYNSNIETFTMEIPISDDELYTKKRDYLENMIIRCIWELIKYTNEDLEDEKNYAKANALALYLQSALSLVPFKDHYKKLAEQLMFRLSDEEADSIVREFSTLESQMALLDDVDTEGVEEMIYPFLAFFADSISSLISNLI